jgi:hypothetical protein
MSENKLTYFSFSGKRITMKNLVVFISFLMLSSCLISHPKPEECAIVETTITKIIEGPSYDILFRNEHGDNFYINRGLQQGLNLEELNTSVLNKTVTLHLARLLAGTVTSEHIAQIEVEGQIIYTEFE